MSWITMLWSMLVSASLTFALLHLFIWAKGIRPWANLSFAATAVAVAFITGMELMIMRTTAIEQMSTLLRWVNLPLLALWLGIVCFVRFYFDAGRSWLAWSAISLRALALILSFTTGQSLIFKEITGLKQITVLGGETINIVQGILNPCYVFGPLSVLVLAAFVLDAAFSLWRVGTDTSRRRAIGFSTSIIFFLLAAVVHSILVNVGTINSPYIIGLCFMPVLLAMSYDLSCDLLNSVQIADQLRASEAELRMSKQRMNLAASAANLRLWEWDIVRDQIWRTDKTRTLHGNAESKEIDFDSHLNSIFAEDREQVRLAVEKSMKGDGDYESEYRIQMPDGRLHWFNSRGRIEFSDRHQPLRMLGVTIDITPRRKAELEVLRQRSELMHLSRVTLLGELSGSLAHELNQPLTAILSNAQAALRFLERDKSDLAEVLNILNDIVAEDKRAREIIHRLRLLLKKGETHLMPIDLNKVVNDVLKLMNGDLANHNLSIHVDLDSKLPPVMGDRVQLQQVLLNLIMNACDALSTSNASKRQVIIRSEFNGIDKARLSVADKGQGIPRENLESIFEPFFTTKSHGMGLGLTICRTIISAHGGELCAANNNPSGATFYFTLPFYEGESA
ncbi:MAG: sensor histidine kinase [Gammaproteobacteria bacterium]